MRTTSLLFAFCMMVVCSTTFSQNKELAALRAESSAGNCDALYHLGVAYFYAEYGAPLDQEQGILYLRRAAECGSSRASFELGIICYEQQAYALAVSYLQRVAEDFPEAAKTLARMYREGLGVEPDAERAAMYQRMAE